MAGKRSRCLTPKLEIELDVTSLKVTEHVNDYLAATVYYGYYRLLKKSSCYEDDMAHEWQKIARRIAAQTKIHIFTWERPDASNWFPTRFQVGMRRKRNL